MRHIAIVGSGPAGCYTAEAAQKLWDDAVLVDVFDSLPVPFGLIRTGVAPDHQSIKGVANRYAKTASGANVRFVGNVTIGRDVAVTELLDLYDAVVLATGAPEDRALAVEGAELGNVFGSAEVVGWYNGHPKFASLDPDLSGRTAVIVGAGNVALDVARILAKTSDEFAGSDIVGHALHALGGSGIERIVILSRRGPHDIQMTPKELGELGELARAVPVVKPGDLPPEESDAALDPGRRKSVQLLRNFARIGPEVRAAKRIRIEFRFFASPLRLSGEGDGEDKGDGAVRSVTVERTRVEDGRALGTGESYELPADLVVSCIGYRTSPIEGVPFDVRAGRFANEDGRIGPGLYCVGWARRGPSGTIGTNRPDGYALVDRIARDIGAGGGRKGRAGFDALAVARGLDVVTFRDWQRIEEAEIAAARAGSPREKFVDVASMIAARDGR